MRKLIFIGTAIALIAASAVHSQPATNKDQILGTWKAETLKVTSGGEVTHPLGQHPGGFVIVPMTGKLSVVEFEMTRSQ